MNDPEEPIEVARRLLEFASRVEPIRISSSDFLASRDEQELLLNNSVAVRYVRQAEEMIGSLKEALENVDWHVDVSEIPESERNRWTFGTAIELWGVHKPILRGFIQPMQKVPILRRMPDQIALFLISIDNGEDYLDRETHGMGLHYHYLNWREERSNVVLSWDTRWKAPDPQTAPPTLRGLFVEPHGEKSNAAFVAKPHLWGAQKRASLHAACVPDLSKWPIKEFKCAANKSTIVHPPGRTLTPHPDAISTVMAKAAASAKKIKKRRR